MNQPLAVQVSNRQYNVMREALQSNGISVDRMIHISQVTVGGLFRRNFMAFHKKSGVYRLTNLGTQVMQQYELTNVERQDSSRPLSKFIPGSENYQSRKAGA